MAARRSNSSHDRLDQPLASRAPEPVHAPPTPFVWQHGRMLLLLDRDPAGWLFAELRFVAADCRYVEVLRAAYDWSGEAVGVLISRALPHGEAAAGLAADAVREWLGSCRRDRWSIVGDETSAPTE